MVQPTFTVPLWRRFHVRLTLLYGAAVFGALAPMALAFYFFGVDGEMRALKQRMATTATALATSLDGVALTELAAPADKSKPLYARTRARFAAVCAQDPEIKNIYVLLRTSKPGELAFALDYDADEPTVEATIGDRYDASRFPRMIEGLTRTAVEDEASADAWGLSLSGYAPVSGRAGEPSVGVLGIDVKGQRIAETKNHVLIVSSLLSLLALLLLSAAAVLAGRNVREPLHQMITATGAIAQGELTTRLALTRDDEFGVVGEHFDTMAVGLQERQRIRDTFGRYVSEEVARSVLGDEGGNRLGGEEREVTVLFSDLRGYSTISEQLAPTEVVDLLNRYLGGMNEVIDKHGGVVIEFLGDAIMAVFGAPNDLPHHADAALRCALEMQTTLEQLNAVWEEEGLARRWQDVGLAKLDQRIGLHTGDVVAGNLGSRTRTKYAVIGDTVNVAARLEQLNKSLNTNLLCSDAVHERVSDELRAQLVRAGEYQVKGRVQPVGAWTVPSEGASEAIAPV